MSSLPLRPYQTEALAAIEEAERRGVRRQLVALPTGTGKTVVFAHFIGSRPGRALILAHRDELLSQAADKVRRISPNTEIGIVKAEQDQHDADVVVASVQTLSRFRRLTRLQPNFSTIVIDEAHHAVAQSYQDVLGYLGACQDDGPLTLGVTATAKRGDKAALGEVFQEIVFERSILEMIEAHYLCDLRAVQVRVAADFNDLHTRAGDFVDSEVEQALLDADAPEHVVKAYQEHADGRKALLFTPTVKLAHAMAQAFREAGIAAEALHGGTEPEKRKAILKRLESGQTRVVANCAVLTEGFDEPSIECIIVACPTKSQPLFVQMVGRGTRLHPGKEDCLILDVVGATARHDLVTTASLFGLDPKAITANGVGAVLATKRQQEEQQQAKGRLVAVAVELFKQRPLHWVHAEGGRFLLQLGQGETLQLVPDGEVWAVLRVDKEGYQVLRRGLDLGYAQGFAEDYARNNGDRWLLDPEASWRNKPASDRQLDALRRQRIRVGPEITRGEASDLLARVFSRTPVGSRS